jgi:acyl-coenzyme A thioesterase PaaI-like protein
MTSYQFDADTAVEEIGPHRFAGELHARWTIMGVPNGGYAMALPLSVCRTLSSHPDPVTTTAHFLSPTTPGPVEVSADILKAGRTTTTIASSLIQDGRVKLHMLTTLGNLDARQGPSHSYLAPPALRGPFETRRSMLVQEFPTNFDLQIPQSVAGGAFGNPSGDPEIGGTIAFADGRPPDLVSLPVMADGFPPVAFNLGHASWTPTLELTIHFWNHPVPGPVTVWLHSAVVQQGFHDESADLWDAAGNLVARSRQLALIL